MKKTLARVQPFKKMLTAIQEKGIVLNSIQFDEGFFADADNEDADEKYLHDLLNVSDSQLKHYRKTIFGEDFLMTYKRLKSG